jgi:hypothetical protein
VSGNSAEFCREVVGLAGKVARSAGQTARQQASDGYGRAPRHAGRLRGALRAAAAGSHGVAAEFCRIQSGQHRARGAAVGRARAAAGRSGVRTEWVDRSRRSERWLAPSGGHRWRSRCRYELSSARSEFCLNLYRWSYRTRATPSARVSSAPGLHWIRCSGWCFCPSQPGAACRVRLPFLCMSLSGGLVGSISAALRLPFLPSDEVFLLVACGVDLVPDGCLGALGHALEAFDGLVHDGVITRALEALNKVSDPTPRVKF